MIATEKKPLWCLFIGSDNKAISDAIPCDPSIFIYGSNVLVQTAENKEDLENTIRMLGKPKRTMTFEVIQRLKQYKADGSYLKIADTIKEYTGTSLCCKPSIDQFVDSL